VLHRNPGQGRKRLGLAKHAIGQIGLKADALPLAGAEGSALVQDGVRDPEPPEAMHETGSAQKSHVRLGQPQPCTRLRGELGNRPPMPQEVGRLQVDEVGDRPECGVEAVAAQHYGERRLGIDDGIPHSDGVETREDDVALGLDQVGQHRVEVTPPPLARELLRGPYSPHAVRDLDELGNMRETGGERDPRALELAPPAASVPALVRSAEGRDDLVRQGELLRHGLGDRGVVGDHAVHLAVPGEREFEPEPKSVQRWVPGAEEPYSRGSHPQTPGLVVVFDRLQGDVVAELLRLLVGVGVATDVDQQRGVVDDRALLFVESDSLGQPQRDQALSQDMLHRLPETEVYAERERGDQLR
jgi:hypothetical protein